MAGQVSRAAPPGRRLLVVEPAPASRQPSDLPQRVDAATAGVELSGDGRAVVEVGAARGVPAIVGVDRPAGPSGRRTIEIIVDGWRFELEVEDARLADLRERATRDPELVGGGGGPLEIRAIIPGRVAAVAVAPGDVVTAGQTLLVVEAMKMQNELRTPRDGTVERVAVGVGETIDLGDLLVVLE
jgi:biotin carboxyl carrier protein